MTILLAPSETKSVGGEGRFCVRDLCFDGIDRQKVIDAYETCLNDATCVQKIFSTTKDKDSDINNYQLQTVKKAILRYEGVAFEYLDYLGLDLEAKNYIHSNVYLFSNLYGIVRACDNIPYYRLKQGAKIAGFNPAQHYKKQLAFLDKQFDTVLDLSAAHYEKFYKPKKTYYSAKFIKNGKTVSHWAKAYRGILARVCAQNNIQTIAQLLEVEIDGLEYLETVEDKNKKTLVYAIDPSC
ncbi:MAG: YaaA family protein [Campylobacterota bacterium]